MSDAVAINPLATSPSSAKSLNEQDNKPRDEGEPSAFANVMQAVVPPPPPPIEAPATTVPGAELPVADAQLPPDLAATGLLGAVSIPIVNAELKLPDGVTASVRATRAPVLANGARAPVVKSEKPDLAPQQLPVTATDADVATANKGFLNVFGAQGQAGLAGESAGAGALALAANTSAATTPVPGTEGLAVAAGHPAEKTEAPKLTLDSKLPLMSPQFAARFAEQVTVLVEHGVKLAHISLNPPELGPIEVRISLVQDEAKVQFSSPHGVVREAMNDALPKLREMLESSGLRLHDSGVFAQLPQRDHLGGQATGSPPLAPPSAAWDEQTEVPVSSHQRSLHLIDAYA